MKPLYQHKKIVNQRVKPSDIRIESYKGNGRLLEELGLENKNGDNSPNGQNNMATEPIDGSHWSIILRI